MFCTFAHAMSGSVPGANVSVIWAVPDESPVEYMYSIRSIPVIVVSIGWITLLSTVAAEAPGYVAVIAIEGGAIGGYCEIGRL